MEETIEIKLEFKPGVPPEAGWYYAAVSFDPENPNDLTTVMLWYNPASTGVWWYDCGVALNPWGKTYAVVKRWAKVPKV